MELQVTGINHQGQASVLNSKEEPIFASFFLRVQNIQLWTCLRNVIMLIWKLQIWFMKNKETRALLFFSLIETSNLITNSYDFLKIVNKNRAFLEHWN